MSLLNDHQRVDSVNRQRPPDDPDIDIFSACPASLGKLGQEYAERVRNVALWSERYGCRGILVYSDNRLVDPWLVAHIIVQNTRRLSPLVAVQPAYMHAYTVANMVATMASVHGRRLYLNWVAGGFARDLAALGNPIPHDERYDRLLEYASVVRRLTDGETVTFEGTYVETRNLSLEPEVDERLRPGFLVSGSSPAGAEAARTLKATAVTYALPPDEDPPTPDRPGPQAGLRVGILARRTREEAWRKAYERFPPDREGALMRHLARRVSDSHWHERLCRTADAQSTTFSPYWMGPFKNYKTMCPYLVGSREEVADILSGYLRAGFSTFILDVPRDESDLAHARAAFEMARSRSATAV